ncbi:MAG: ABC transporter substrate-binding protein [Sterolibacterium sp.]|nr:ABC transporter substrate-binding protein [Sterolibacterium sp.]
MKPLVRSFRLLFCLLFCLLAGLGTSANAKEKQQAPAQETPKTLRWMFSAAATGFDPAGVHDYYSGTILEAVFETLLTYDYLANPPRLVPQIAAAMPQVSADGLTYTIAIKPGIHFAPDPVFAGAKRELTAADVVYSWQRLLDPKVRSPYSFLVENRFVGLDALALEAQRTGHFDYDRTVPGLRALDRYTLQLQLLQPDPNLLHVLAFSRMSVLAREVVERYGDLSQRVMDHPVGSGPFRLKQWQRGAKIVLERNPNYHGLTWDFAASAAADDAAAQRIVRQMQGKALPAIERIVISIMEEDQARWLAFQNDELDVMNMDGPLAPRALDGSQLKPALAARGIQLSRVPDMEVMYHYWQWNDPVVGGMGKPQIALRRALAMAYDVAEEIRVVRNGQAIALDYPIPPGVAGHAADWHSSVTHDVATANALLDRYGYAKGADGWRRQPNGQPLSIRYASRPDSMGRQQEEMWQKAFHALSIRMESQKMPFPELIKLEKQCRLQMRSAGWIGDYPDGDNFMQLLYGPRSGQSNAGCIKIPEYDRLYAASQRLPDGPERNQLYHQMARLIEYYAPWRLGLARVRNMLLQPRVIGYRKHPILHAEWLYMDLDETK